MTRTMGGAPSYYSLTQPCTTTVVYVPLNDIKTYTLNISLQVIKSMLIWQLCFFYLVKIYMTMCSWNARRKFIKNSCGAYEV